MTWGIHKIAEDDAATRFYTGLPSFGFEPAFPDLKTDQLTAALSLGVPVLRTEGLLQISLQMIEKLSRLC